MNVPPPTDQGDRLPLWVIALCAVFLLLRVFDLLPTHEGGHLSQQMVGQVDEKTMTDMVDTNTKAKTAFVSEFGKPGDSAPDGKSLREALHSAESLQKKTQNAPGAARRVLILRGLLKQPLFGPGKSGPDPRLAFQPAALADLPPGDARQYSTEGKIWADIAGGPHLTPAQTAADAQALRATPNIRWWQYPALSLLYQSQNDPLAAHRYAKLAQTQAVITLLPLSLVAIVFGGLGLVGAGLLMYFGIRVWLRRTAAPGDALPPDVWPTLPEPVSRENRRLRAGDLMGVFIVYLLMPDLLGWLLGGVGIRHLFRFPGLLGPYRHSLVDLPASSRVAANVVLAFVAYLVSAAVPIGLLLAIARRKGASIGRELGWNTQRLGMNLLYGVGGYAVSLPFLWLAILIGPRVFPHAPTPSNPAIPLLASASSPWVQIMLVLLATVAAPLTEEFLFRGVFYNAAKLRVGVWPAILLTGFIFGFVHPVGIAEMLPLAMLGGVFAWMAETRKSLAPSILGHCMQNTMATLMLLLALGG